MNKQVSLETIETSQGGGFSVSMLGPIPFIQPLGVSLPSDFREDLVRAGGLVGMGAIGPATAIVGHVERQLGVSPELHIAGVLAGAARLAEMSRERAAAKAETAAVRAAVLMQPLRPVALGGAAEFSLAQAALQREVAVAATKSKDRKTANAALSRARGHEIWADTAQRTLVDAIWIEGAEAETVALRAARDDLAAVQLEEGARLSVQDGLATLQDGGTITNLQEMAGRAYRQMLEDAPQRLRSQLDIGTGRAGGDPVGAGLLRAFAGVRLTRVEFAVASLGRRELRTLRWVAGMGGSIRSLSSGGKGREANTQALIRALDVAASVIWTTRPLRIGGH
ncbi:MAG: hypothetical protein WA047_20530 [Phenylobacterium sp.]|uniref:hypothetical protein n=1 Tax=Phenylobacterium sp. TaxID=1871053 RepID=UPI003BB6CF2D